MGRPHLSARPPTLRVILSERDVLANTTEMQKVTSCGGTGSCGISLFYSFTTGGTHRWCTFTTHHVDRYVAIVVDKVVLADSQIQTPICEVPGVFGIILGAQQAFTLAGFIRTGPLPVGLSLAPTRPLKESQ